VSDETIQRLKRELARSGQSPRDIALGMLRFYRLRWAIEDQEMQFWFAALHDEHDPTEDGFQALCDSLVPEASRRAVDRASAAGLSASAFVGWGEIVTQIGLLLEERGFVAITKTSLKADYEGGGLITSVRLATQEESGVRCPDFVIEHNQRASEELRRSRRAGTPGQGGPITITGGTGGSTPGRGGPVRPIMIGASATPGGEENIAIGFGSEPRHWRSTMIAAGSAGQALPQPTIYVESIEGFPDSGTILIATDRGLQTVSYTGLGRGIVEHMFMGCVGGEGVMAAGNMVDIPHASSGPPYFTNCVFANCGRRIFSNTRPEPGVRVYCPAHADLADPLRPAFGVDP